MSEEKNKNKKATKDEVLEGEFVEQAAGAEEATGAENAAGTFGAAVSQAEYDLLAQKLQQAESQVKDYFEGWQRERADFANYKRRMERDQQAIQQNITMDVVKKYLTVVDDMERALKNRPTDGGDAAWASGIELILRKLQGILESEGLKRIAAEDEEFNPARHEAISYEVSPGHSGGQIIEVVQQGYTLGDRVVRPALVRVARG